MTVTYGFYNSVNDDRLYDATQMSRLFEGIINDGVFSTIGTSLGITSAAGMNVTIGVGRAWFNNTWTDNDTPFNLVVPDSHMTLNRIDTLVLEVDTREAARANTFKIVSGVAATNPVRPTLAPPAEVYQYPLADLSIPAGAVTIPQGNITNRIGTVDCPFITGALSTVSIEALLANWENQFSVWFDEMKDQLTVDAAGNLQTQINAMSGIWRRNAVINGGMVVAQRAPASGSNQTNITTTPTYLADRMCVFQTGGVDLEGNQRVLLGSGPDGFQSVLRIQRLNGNAFTYPLIMSQCLESYDSFRFKGKTATLSFYAAVGANFSGAGSAIKVKIGYGTGTDQTPALFAANGWTGQVNLVNDVSCVLTGSYVRYSYTVTIPVGATQIGFQFTHTPTGVAGAADIFYITGIQFEEGVVASPFEFLPYAEDLRQCQRFYYCLKPTGYNEPLADAQAISQTQARATVIFPVSMRKAPTLVTCTLVSDTSFSMRAANGGAGGGGVNAFTTYSSRPERICFTITCSGTAALTAGYMTALTSAMQDNVWVGFDAELER